MGRAVRGFAEFLGGLVVGIAVGYAAAVLLAPYEGAESRARLYDGAGEFADRPRQMADNMQARFKRAVEQGRIAAAETRAELEKASGLESEETRRAARGATTSI